MAKDDVYYHIRWMIRRDMPEVLHIDQSANPDYYWTEEEYLSALRQRNCIGMVAEKGEAIVGFMVYELQKTKLHLLHMCVHPDMQRNGVGRAMMKRLYEKLSSHRRTGITMLVPDAMTAMHLFLRKMGFKAKFVKTPYYNTNDDGYFFEYKLQSEAQTAVVATEEDEGSLAE